MPQRTARRDWCSGSCRGRGTRRHETRDLEFKSNTMLMNFLESGFLEGREEHRRTSCSWQCRGSPPREGEITQHEQLSREKEVRIWWESPPNSGFGGSSVICKPRGNGFAHRLLGDEWKS